MKKILIIGSILLTFTITSFVYASNQEKGNGIHEPGTGLVNPELKEANQEVNKTKNQINNNEQSNFKDDEENDDEENYATSTKRGKGDEMSAQRRSIVANAVKELLSVSDRVGGIGEQVREIARAQNQNQEKIEAGLEEVQSRGGFSKFFIGPKYNEIEKTKTLLNQNQEQITKLVELKNQLKNKEDLQDTEEQIKVLEKVNLEVKDLLSKSEKGFSLFGWLFK